jgi:hypothetical protein
VRPIHLFPKVETKTTFRLPDYKLRQLLRLPKRKGAFARFWFDINTQVVEIDFVKVNFPKH